MAQGCAARYRARNPRATPLYRLLKTQFDEVREQWEERYERRCGFWRGFMPKMLRPYFLHHRELLGGLAHAAWETVLELMIASMGALRRDVPGTALCRNGYPALRRASHNADAGHSAGSALHCGCSGSVGGRRRVISVVEGVPVSPRTTTLMARRWGAEGGLEGRSFRLFGPQPASGGARGSAAAIRPTNCRVLQRVEGQASEG